jgi:hypothetical protein
VRDASSCVASLAARGVAPPDIACEWPARQRAAVSSGAVLSKMTEERYVPSLHGHGPHRGATSPRGGGGAPHDRAFAGAFGGDLGASLALLGYDERGEEDATSASQRARSRWQRTRDLARSTVAKVKAYRALGGLGSSGQGWGPDGAAAVFDVYRHSEVVGPILPPRLVLEWGMWISCVCEPSFRWSSFPALAIVQRSRETSEQRIVRSSCSEDAPRDVLLWCMYGARTLLLLWSNLLSVSFRPSSEPTSRHVDSTRLLSSERPPPPPHVDSTTAAPIPC